jgi:WXG100 family type VII secretion target
MTRFHVDSEAVAAATARIQARMSRIQAETGGLGGELGELQSSWTGQAATAFQSAAAEWRATQQRVEEALGAIGTALAYAGQQYVEIELQNARLFAR